MILCRFKDCLHNTGSSCSLENITISANGSCWSRKVSKRGGSNKCVELSWHERVQLLEHKFEELEKKRKC